MDDIDEKRLTLLTERLDAEILPLFDFGIFEMFEVQK
jgi:hypothetical protein